MPDLETDRKSAGETEKGSFSIGKEIECTATEVSDYSHETAYWINGQFAYQPEAFKQCISQFIY